MNKSEKLKATFAEKKLLGHQVGRDRVVDYDKVKALYATGNYTQTELADLLKVSKGAIQNALKK